MNCTTYKTLNSCATCGDGRHLVNVPGADAHGECVEDKDLPECGPDERYEMTLRRVGSSHGGGGHNNHTNASYVSATLPFGPGLNGLNGTNLTVGGGGGSGAVTSVVKCVSCGKGSVPGHDSSDCAPCPWNTFEKLAEPGTCATCPHGKHTTGEGRWFGTASPCIPCARGKYQAARGGNCTACPPGTETDGTGSTDVAACRCKVGLTPKTGKSPGAGCVECDPACAACQDGKPGTCTRCATTRADGVPVKLYLDTYTGACEEECPRGGFKDGADPTNRVCKDDTKPVFECAAPCRQNFTEYAWDDGKQAEVYWVPPAVRDNDPNTTVACTARPGDKFDVGEHAVVCTASDRANNVATFTFHITVLAGDSANCPSPGAPGRYVRNKRTAVCCGVGGDGRARCGRPEHSPWPTALCGPKASPS